MKHNPAIFLSDDWYTVTVYASWLTRLPERPHWDNGHWVTPYKPELTISQASYYDWAVRLFDQECQNLDAGCVQLWMNDREIDRFSLRSIES